MSFASQTTQQKFPFNYDDVFDVLTMSIQNAGMTVNSKDKIIGRITASAGMSLFSWGENLTIIVEKIDDNSTIVGIESSLKFGANLTGAHRHQNNFNKIIATLSKNLQMRKTDCTGSVAIDQERKCPFCAEAIKIEAVVCRFCNRDLPSYNETIKVTVIEPEVIVSTPNLCLRCGLRYQEEVTVCSECGIELEIA